MASIEVTQEPDISETHLRQGCYYLPVDMTYLNNFEKMTSILIRYLELSLEKIDTSLNRKGEKIVGFTIGKTYGITKKQFRKNFSGANANHWKKDGILRRYHTTYKNKGYSFLIAFGIITRHNIPPDVPKHLKDQETLALGLEMQLILHFCYSIKDHRLDNQTIDVGKRAKEKHAGVVLYVAIKHERIGLHTSIRQ